MRHKRIFTLSLLPGYSDEGFYRLCYCLSFCLDVEVTGGPKAGLETAHSATQGDNERVWPSPADGKDGVGVGVERWGCVQVTLWWRRGWGTLKP